jgi:hypothetical protein
MVAAVLLPPAITCSFGDDTVHGGAAPTSHHLLVQRWDDTHGSCASPAGHHPLLSWCGGRSEKTGGEERLEEKGKDGGDWRRSGNEGIGEEGSVRGDLPPGG